MLTNFSALTNCPLGIFVHFNSTLCTARGCRWIAVLLTVQMNPSQWEYPQSSFNGRVEKGDSPSKLVRTQRRVSRKRYLNSKRLYEYERVSLNIPRKYHELIKPFLNQDFDVSVATRERHCRHHSHTAEGSSTSSKSVLEDRFRSSSRNLTLSNFLGHAKLLDSDFQS